MPNKDALIAKLCGKPMPKNFTTRELDTLMSKCNCEKHQGGRGSSVAYVHRGEKRETLQFDVPHPGNELYGYQIKMVIKFLEKIGEK